jgi:lantibiotic modifying enzyme
MKGTEENTEDLSHDSLFICSLFINTISISRLCSIKWYDDREINNELERMRKETVVA